MTTILTEALIPSLLRQKGTALSLNLNQFSEIEDRAAQALASEGICEYIAMGRLELNGLKSLSDAAAIALAETGSVLSLNGLKSLTNSAAAALGSRSYGDDIEFNQELWLNGLESISDEALESLASVEAPLFLDGLSALSENQADILSKGRGILSLNGIVSLSDSVALALAKHRMQPTPSTELSIGTANSSLPQRYFTLYGVKALSGPALAGLANSTCEINNGSPAEAALRQARGQCVNLMDKISPGGERVIRKFVEGAHDTLAIRSIRSFTGCNLLAAKALIERIRASTEGKSSTTPSS